jgi:hypothetical protein
MAEPALDDVSANLGEVLRHADALLAEWSQFGASVRAQVEREAAQIGRAVSDGTGAAVERAVRDQLAAMTRELAHLEERVRAASRGLSDQRAHDRRWLAAIAGGVAVALALLVVMVVRGPAAAPPLALRVEPAQVAPLQPPPDAHPPDAAVPADASPPPADAARPARRR